jgi:hypothetical protein
MKYPFALSIITAAVFAFMAILILGGDVRFGAPDAPEYTLKIISVNLSCRAGELNRAPELRAAMGEVFVKKLRASCDDKPLCEVNTAALYAEGQRLPACTEALSITYHCAPKAHDRQAFLYEGQHATLHCQ